MKEHIVKDIELDVLSIIKTLYGERRKIVIITACTALFGIVIALTSPKEWLSVTELMPETKSLSGLGGSLGSLAGLAGISLDDADSGINPDLYPNIANSTPFLFNLATKKYYFKELDKEIELREYLRDEMKLSLFGTIISLSLIHI